MTKKILFVCVGNSCRSQIAEGFARELGGNDVEVRSAGTRPALVVSGKAERVMEEKGVRLTGQHPKELDPGDLEWADRVIVMGCGVEDKKLDDVADKVEDWGIEDPVGQPVETYREVRDEIEGKVRGLVEKMKGKK